MDGVIVEGESNVDESQMTGESVPVKKGAGATVMGATIEKTGDNRATAERVAGELGIQTTFAEVLPGRKVDNV